MRNPDRIQPIMDNLTSIWKENPDWRFGQLMVNIIRASAQLGGKDDPWFDEDDHWALVIEEMHG